MDHVCALCVRLPHHNSFIMLCYSAKTHLTILEYCVVVMPFDAMGRVHLHMHIKVLSW